jgi:hypothetical protein
VLLDQLEKVFMVIGDRVIMAGGGYKNFDEFDVSEDNITSELVIRPRPGQPKKTLETRQSLNNMTKHQICELSLERFGVALNYRVEKKALISEFLEFQSQEP